VCPRWAFEEKASVSRPLDDPEQDVRTGYRRDPDAEQAGMRTGWVVATMTYLQPSEPSAFSTPWMECINTAGRMLAPLR